MKNDMTTDERPAPAEDAHIHMHTGERKICMYTINWLHACGCGNQARGVCKVLMKLAAAAAAKGQLYFFNYRFYWGICVARAALRVPADSILLQRVSVDAALC